ncbi:MAG: hypothetical protein A2268_00030 [Candidatus Raymondbacteria bacterium RifOxyA12_full_50_37]|uniref:Response regulatory domain-containing protein n=1 Tax=Candidatus Raymondbacteria bacterium RIFOXYD12_FULL_49_13 TaxID=1817890 RepID=A0A1F7F3D4_UNCRA|nr:MAG: hypothetical protein A2248_00370 [Candidatus Raymondbacteria bacterium RIFOXYA2_FULL_49_16]OGJ91094.1 MAG: hypothetical protein A2350_07300 [Candidatus Raymondbacteria bacterium RifOxyB12_full_50_8]OGJ91363.1 MAG: hypothetical protein A2268_00030 [Candidatus Raymondbacteria bacterium RifOxyA12_full_50_37]OGJ97148.1 MAG: hypothetical protein A2453_12550 [Candidatus Raymondbacteria bacterium RIFOXYC2_FULL_50_21]OGK01151.1 MAG: hypothetical protein A2519_01345 [Candidatus Raymondbacteria b
MIIEDDTDIQDYYRIVLGKLPVEIVCAGNGEEAFLILNSGKRIDLILLDAIMPVMDGGVFLQKLRQEQKSSIPVIPCSVDEKSVECLTQFQQFDHIFIKTQGGRVLQNIVAQKLGL